MGCGLGKTIIVLTALHDLYYELEVEHILIIAPLRVATATWPNEIDLWAHTRGLSFAVACGDAKERRAALNRRATITLINKESVPWLARHFNKQWYWDTVVIDEASAFKSHDSKRFKAMKSRASRYRRLIELTGTPACNGLLDLWAQAFLLDQGKRLGVSFTGYRKARFIQSWNGYGWSPAPDTEEWVYKQLQDKCLTMKAEDYLDMPKRKDVYHELTLTDKQRETYDELAKHYMLEVPDGEITAMNAAVLANKLLQVCSGAAYLDGQEGGYTVIHDAKLDALEDIYNESAGTPLLVAYNFKSDLARLQKRFPFAVVLDKDPATITKWNNKAISMLLAHPASAGHGLNLQHGSHICVWFSLIWSLELYQQFCARLDRQGQTKPVLNHHLTVKGTIEERVVKVLATKEANQNRLLDALKGNTDDEKTN